MPDIRYVCISDLHFDEEDSVLTNLQTASSEVDTSPSLIAPDRDPWETFSEKVANALEIRRKHLRKRVYGRLRS